MLVFDDIVMGQPIYTCLDYNVLTEEEFIIYTNCIAAVCRTPY